MRLEPWAEADLDLLRRINDPAMMTHLGGPETDEQVISRHRRYLATNTAAGRMFRIVVLPGDEPAGNVGYWERQWRGNMVYETGWSVLPAFQGLGVATAAAAAAMKQAAAERRNAHAHAFPSVDNPASNAICRKLGFVLLGECDFEYPPGHPMRCNDWRLELDASLPATSRDIGT